MKESIELLSSLCSSVHSMMKTGNTVVHFLPKLKFEDLHPTTNPELGVWCIEQSERRSLTSLQQIVLRRGEREAQQERHAKRAK
jgi:hypothetical protein